MAQPREEQIAHLERELLQLRERIAFADQEAAKVRERRSWDAVTRRGVYDILPLRDRLHVVETKLARLKRESSQG